MLSYRKWKQLNEHIGGTFTLGLGQQNKVADLHSRWDEMGTGMPMKSKKSKKMFGGASPDEGGDGGSMGGPPMGGPPGGGMGGGGGPPMFKKKKKSFGPPKGGEEEDMGGPPPDDEEMGDEGGPHHDDDGDDDDMGDDDEGGPHHHDDDGDDDDMGDEGGPHHHDDGDDDDMGDESPMDDDGDDVEGDTPAPPIMGGKGGPMKSGPMKGGMPGKGGILDKTKAVADGAKMMHKGASKMIKGMKETSGCNCNKCKKMSKKWMQHEDAEFFRSLQAQTGGTHFVRDEDGDFVPVQEDAIIPPSDPNANLQDDEPTPGRVGYAPQGRVGSIGNYSEWSNKHKKGAAKKISESVNRTKKTWFQH